MFHMAEKIVPNATIQCPHYAPVCDTRRPHQVHPSELLALLMMPSYISPRRPWRQMESPADATR